jgi:hypothetical protein
MSGSYTLQFRLGRPHVTLTDGTGHALADLFALSSVHGSELDDSTGMGHWTRKEAGGETIFSLAVTSSLWESKTVRFRCLPTRFIYQVEIAGTGPVTDFTPFGGFMSALPRWGSGFFPSGHGFSRIYNPEPNTLDRNYLSPDTGSVIDLTGAPLPGKRHWFFTPAPMCFAAQGGKGWVGLGVEAAPGSNQFSAYRYHGGDGFWLSLAYDGATAVDGRIVLPAIGFYFGPDELSVLQTHVVGLTREGMAPDVDRPKPGWWSRPMFCGWGAQCARAGDEWGREDANHFLAAMSHAAEYARQSEYAAFLSSLAGHGLCPGTIVIDDKWQETYGDNRVDVEKWPDLPGFIADRHAEGRHVLLWLKAWDREGVPDEECIRSASGRPLAVDPTHPGYQARLRESIRRMLGPDGYDADGFKIDFTHRIPVGPSLRLRGEARGLELMKVYLGIIYNEAKRVKADALVMTHTPHPYLADVTDMIRLNDMLDLTRLDDPSAGLDIRATLEQRAAVARIACPHALIDTDNWPVRNRAVWRDFVRLQPAVGVPSLYFSTHIDLTGEPLEEADYQLLHEAWNGIDSTHPVPAG